MPSAPRLEDIGAAFVVKDSGGQKLGYFYYEERPARRSVIHRTRLKRCSAECIAYNEVVETVTRADLLLDDEERGLCVRVYGDDSKSFVFVYRIGDRQRFIRLGTSPTWSLDGARARAKELRSIVDRGRDPARENRGPEVPPVEDLVQYIAENLATTA